MFSSLQSIQWIKRIVTVVKDDDDDIKTPPKNLAVPDQFVPASTPQKKHTSSAWIPILWNIRGQTAIDEGFITRVTEQFKKTIESIRRLPDTYRIGPELKDGKHKKESVTQWLQNIANLLKSLHQKTISSLFWSTLSGTSDIQKTLTSIATPVIKLLAEFRSESYNTLEQESLLEKAAIHALVDFIKAVPYSIPTTKDLADFKSQPLNQGKSVEDLMVLFRQDKLDKATEALNDALVNLRLPLELSDLIKNIIVHPENALKEFFPKLVNSTGTTIGDPFNQRLIAYLLELAGNLAPLCAPKKEKSFLFLSDEAHAGLARIFSKIPSMKNFFTKLTSDAKQAKVAEELHDIAKVFPHIIEGLQKSNLGLSDEETRESSFLSSIKGTEKALAERFAYLLNLEKNYHPWSCRWSLLCSKLLFRKNSIQQIENHIERLKNGEITLLHFYNLAQPNPSSPLWLLQLVGTIQKELLDTEEKQALELKQNGNAALLSVVYEQTFSNLQEYKKLHEKLFGEGFWRGQVERTRKLIQEPLETYLRAHTRRLELMLSLKAGSNTHEIIGGLDELHNQIDKQRKFISALQMRISAASGEKKRLAAILEEIKT